MWTHKDLKEFKDSIRKEASEAVIKVGHGETVTVSIKSLKLLNYVLQKCTFVSDIYFSFNSSEFLLMKRATVYTGNSQQTAMTLDLVCILSGQNQQQVQ